jgi:hypothetical protein
VWYVDPVHLLPCCGSFCLVLAPHQPIAGQILWLLDVADTAMRMHKMLLILACSLLATHLDCFCVREDLLVGVALKQLHALVPLRSTSTATTGTSRGMVMQAITLHGGQQMQLCSWQGIESGCSMSLRQQ